MVIELKLKVTYYKSKVLSNKVFSIFTYLALIRKERNKGKERKIKV